MSELHNGLFLMQLDNRSIHFVGSAVDSNFSINSLDDVKN